MEKEIKYYCLYCGVKLDFVPTEDGGFCSTECEDSWNETFVIEEELEAQRTDAAERETHRREVEGEIE